MRTWEPGGSFRRFLRRPKGYHFAALRETDRVVAETASPPDLEAMRTPSTLALLAGFLVGCSSLGFESEVTNKTPFSPPEVYADWWDATEACSGLDGDFARVSWYLATGITGDGKVASGRWSQPHDIVIVRGYEGDETIVRHEMLHDLLDGDPDHTSALWVACGLAMS